MATCLIRPPFVHKKGDRKTQVLLYHYIELLSAFSNYLAILVVHHFMIGFYDLSLDYLDTFTAKVEAVTAEQIRDAFERRVTPDKLITVMVGTPEKEAAQGS